MKRCSKCKEEKPEGEFHRDKRGKDGRVAKCKACVSKYGKAWNAANRELKAEVNRLWFEANRERKKATNKSWREANRERHALLRKAWREANRERIATVRKAQYESNRERAATLCRAWYEANRERKKATDKAWLATDKGMQSRVRKYLKASLGFQPPEALVEVKALQLQVKRLIKEKTDGV